jgi:hypothetical protein
MPVGIKNSLSSDVRFHGCKARCVGHGNHCEDITHTYCPHEQRYLSPDSIRNPHVYDEPKLHKRQTGRSCKTLSSPVMYCGDEPGLRTRLRGGKERHQRQLRRRRTEAVRDSLHAEDSEAEHSGERDRVSNPRVSSSDHCRLSYRESDCYGHLASEMQQG